MSSNKNVLAEIVEWRKLTLAADLKSTKVPETLNKSTRSLFEALSKPKFGFILECKKASPSKGLIRDDFNIEDIVSSYSQHADAISVLTEPEYFQGNFSLLQQAARESKLPILCKDFVLSPEHIRLARHYGADAVLLMLSVLNDQQYKECSEIANSLDIDILTEVHDQAELERAIKLGANIIGINNRDLKTLTTSFEPTKRLSKQIPSSTLVVTESGINDHSDIIKLANFADACLVGSSLMQQQDLCSAVEKLIYGDIKVCATTNQKDTDLLNQLPCSQIGQVFVPISKRATSLEATPLVSSKPKIGVFDMAYHSVDEIVNTAISHKLAGIQLHGDEDDETINSIRDALPSIRVIKTLHISEQSDVADISTQLANGPADEYLLDTAPAKSDQQARGGTGSCFDWTILKELDLKKVRVAGGINASNIADLKVYGVVKLDLASGSEESPGLKSAAKLQQIFENAKVMSNR